MWNHRFGTRYVNLTKLNIWMVIYAGCVPCLNEKQQERQCSGLTLALTYMSGFANNTLLRDGIRVRVGVRKQRKVTIISLMAIRHHALLLQYIITTNCIVLVEGWGVAQKTRQAYLFT